MSSKVIQIVDNTNTYTRNIKAVLDEKNTKRSRPTADIIQPRSKENQVPDSPLDDFLIQKKRLNQKKNKQMESISISLTPVGC